MSSNSSYDPSIFMYFSYCFTLPSTYYHFIAYSLVNVPFVLPLCLYILRLGVQQWRSRAKISHTDCFTYNMVVVQLISIAGSCLLTVNLIFKHIVVVGIGIYALFVTYTAIVVFQILTCIEHYMAVVHPVTYLGLKSQTWTRIRNVSCGLVWLQCVTQSMWLGQLRDFEGFFIASLLFLLCSVFVALFCNLRVLRALIRPRPGDGAKGNKSKRKVFYSITAIATTLLVKLGGDSFGTLSFLLLANNSTTLEGYDESCRRYFSIIWFTLPSSLVLPLLFLHRKEKLLCCKTKK